MDKQFVNNWLTTLLASVEEQLSLPVLNSDKVGQIEENLRIFIADLKRESSLYKRIF